MQISTIDDRLDLFAYSHPSPEVRRLLAEPPGTFVAFDPYFSTGTREFVETEKFMWCWIRGGFAKNYATIMLLDCEELESRLAIMNINNPKDEIENIGG